MTNFETQEKMPSKNANPFTKLKGMINSSLSKPLNENSTKISESQRKQLEKFGKDIKPIGTKLVVVSNGTERMLFKLTENDDIRRINLLKEDEIEVAEDKFEVSNIENIERVFEKLFIVKYNKNKNFYYRIVKFDPKSGEDPKFSDSYYSAVKVGDSNKSRKNILIHVNKDKNSKTDTIDNDGGEYGSYIPEEYTIVHTK